MRIIFIGNYAPDKQESMLRFTQFLYGGFKDAGYDCEIWQPSIFIGRFCKNTVSGIAKWLGYIDKWLLFPIILSWRLRDKNLRSSETRFHICDHSNAPYLPYLPTDHTGITCHDVLAIRGALGFKDAYCTSTVAGKVLQKWILRNLSKAKLLAATSKVTLSQLQSLSNHQRTEKKDWRIIHLGFNADFKPLAPQERNELLQRIHINPDIPFILHVGSDQPRKNRKMLIDMTAALGNNWDGMICYAGQAADEKLLSYAESLGVRQRVMSAPSPDHNTLLALYSACYAFIWPSFSEGFGWPLIEAQACGAPVISSNFDPMPEVSHGTALHADPTKPEQFAEAFLKLKDDKIRSEIIRGGFVNSSSFKSANMINAYLALHGLKPKQPC
jgi:glycosyltransferase involved in cell wall biosynthesis